MSCSLDPLEIKGSCDIHPKIDLRCISVYQLGLFILLSYVRDVFFMISVVVKSELVTYSFTYHRRNPDDMICVDVKSELVIIVLFAYHRRNPDAVLYE